MRRIIVFGVVTMLFFMLAGCSKPSHTVRNFYDALKVEDYEKAITYTDAELPTYRLNVAFMQLMHLTVSDYEIVNEEITSDSTATVKVRVALSNEDEMSDTDLLLIKKKGNWVIKY